MIRGRKPDKLDVPVVPADVVPTSACDSCGSDRTTRACKVVDGIELVLCLDVHGCVVRYRAGMTAAEYGAALRGDAPEIMAVAP